MFCFLLLSINCTEKKTTVASKQKASVNNLDPHFFEGMWVSADGSTCGMFFEWKKKQLELQLGNDINFIFSKFNNIKSNTINGTIYRWPPQTCYVKVIYNKTIEIQFVDYTQPVNPKRLYIKK